VTGAKAIALIKNIGGTTKLLFAKERAVGRQHGEIHSYRSLQLNIKRPTNQGKEKRGSYRDRQSLVENGGLRQERKKKNRIWEGGGKALTLLEAGSGCQNQMLGLKKSLNIHTSVDHH